LPHHFPAVSRSLQILIYPDSSIKLLPLLPGCQALKNLAILVFYFVLEELPIKVISIKRSIFKEEAVLKILLLNTSSSPHL